ncbi:unnamed protein product [Schistosoma mattheei]|uniref:Eukaryotic translation initiation factor 4C n=1 Tax=Schistosoma mattheei TaxID=31246 RepID=A0A183P9C1_9TREM|nr:unnamed protein product [Schistosoma mattheei]
MPKNKGKGGKNRRRGKNENESQKRDLIYKEAGQEYAKVERLLGNGRLEAYCFDGVKRLCHIRGKLRKKVWISNGDIILIGLRDYQDNKADVIMKYLNDEARTLKSLGSNICCIFSMIGEIPDTIKLEENDDIEFDANAAIFEDDEDDEKGSDSEDEEGSDDDDDNSDDSDEIAEINQRYRADTGIAKDQRNNRRR